MRPSLRLVAILSLFSGLTGCAEIDQNLFALSNAVAPADRVTGQRTLNITSRASQIEQSNQSGNQLLAQYRQAGKPLDAAVSAAQYRRLQTVFARVHSVSHLRDEQWTAYLLPDKEWNAFTMGGTQIFVNKGLMDDLTTDDALAAVIGHEIAHVTANHVYEQNSYTLAAKLQGSKNASTDAFQSAFTLKNEEEADQIGVLYAALAGYDPYAASRLWKKMYEDQGDYRARLIDHPVASARYANTAKLAQEYAQYYTPGKVNPNAPAILESGAQGMLPQLAPGQGGGALAAFGAVSEAVMKNREVKAEQQRQAQEYAKAQAAGQ